MKKLNILVFVMAYLLLGHISAHAVTPTITGTAGTVATGQTLTISGTNMQNEKSGSWTVSQGGFEGSSPSSDLWQGGGSYTTSVKLSGSKSYVSAIHAGGGGTCSGTPFYADHLYSNAGPIHPGYFSMYVRFPPSMLNVFNIIGSGYAKFVYDTGGSRLIAMFQNMTGWPTQLMFAISGVNHWYNLPAQVQPDTWYHLEIAETGSSQYLYWNGTLIATNHDSQVESNMQYTSFGMENACAMAGSAIPTAQFYIDNVSQGTTRRGPSSIVEISGNNGSTWSYQSPETISDSLVAVKLSLPTLTASSYLLRVTNNLQQTSAIYNLSTGSIPDTTAPSIPANLSATASSSSQINLSWSASSDNIAVTGYKIYRNGTYLITTAASPYANAGLTASTLYTYTVSAIDAAGNESAQSIPSSATTQAPPTGSTTLFTESFENTSFNSRGWYDGSTTGTIISGGQVGNASRWAWAIGATKPTNGNALRKKFTPTDSLYVSFYARFNTGWRGSQKSYHPHLFYVASDLDDAENDYTPLANNYLQTYIEFWSKIGTNEIRPQIAIQDEKRVNTSNGTPPVDLSMITENRSVGACNTPVSSGAVGTCYADDPYYSAATWTDNVTNISTAAWHHVEVYLRMNNISGSRGQHDGIMQEWIDGDLKINRSDILYRTNQDATKKWANFILAPYIGDGSPVAQSMDVDELTVGTVSPYAEPTEPDPINGSCGSASGNTFATLTASSPNLCSSGTVASFAGTGDWTWGCNGVYGGTSTSPTACIGYLYVPPSITGGGPFRRASNGGRFLKANGAGGFISAEH